jgi:hypothetical protein
MIRTLFHTPAGMTIGSTHKSTHENYLPTTHIVFYLILGKYYMVDAGYPNRPGYLAPFKGTRYHVPDFRRGPAPSGEHEHFNYLHSSIRNAVERAFGVLKMKWRLLLKMPSFLMEKQKMIVAAERTLMSPRGGVNRRDDQIKLFLPKYLS